MTGSPGETEPYPEFTTLRAEAQRTRPRFIASARLDELLELTRRRGHDWCTAVLARPFPGLRGLNAIETQMLVLADERSLHPDLPGHILQARAHAAEQAGAQQQARQALEGRDRQRWQAALADCAVPVEVRANSRGRRYRTAAATGPLRHVVPLQVASSGPAGRAHLAGRALCETAARAKPLMLSEPTDAPATCVRCLEFTRMLRPST